MSREPDWRALRERFPALEASTYLNTAGGGPLSRDAFEGAHSYLDVAYRLGDTKWEEWLAKVEDTRAKLARLLAVTPFEIAFLSNASLAMNAACDLLPDARAAGRVLLVADDFPSVTLPWLSRGHDVCFVEPGDRGFVDLEAVEKAMESGAPVSVVALSLVHYVTGYRFPLGALADLCRSKDARVVVDATQAFGVIPIEAAVADALFFSGYKWATSGYGIAPLFVRRELLETGASKDVGWRSAREPYEMKSRALEPTNEARGLELGHPPFAGVFALQGSLTLLEEVGLPAIESRVQELVAYLHERLDGMGMEVLSPRKRSERAGITLARVPDPVAVARHLAGRGVFVSARGNGLRLSLHYYNNESDVDRFVAAVSALL